MPAPASLYRRHRPRTFAEVVGQEHVVRTLTNAVALDRVHHAYLFVGSRGTGKTSMAKILAACLNCVNGPTIEPCGTCESCTSIAVASSLDVIEMDAASSNSVDDIRALRDSVAYAPVSGRRKIYILDEAHMLSTAAWNAFLKTLEEPPPDTIFVLATTEAQKVLPTVVDRCHRFDFQRPTAEQIGTVVARTAKAEGIELGSEAVAVLARHAQGSFRDALGTLEQLQTYAGEQIALADVLAVLGISDAELLFRSLDAVARADARGALTTAAAAVDGGHDPATFIRELETHARELLVVQMHDGVVPPELSLTPERDERLCAQAEALSTAALVRTLDLLADALAHLRAGADARTQLELALVKAARADFDPSTAALSARLERLEGATRAPAAGAPADETSPAPPAQPEVVAPPAPPAEPEEAARPPAAAPETTPPTQAAPVSEAPPTPEAAPVSESVPASEDVQAAAPREPFYASPPPASPEPAELAPLDIEGLIAVWPDVLDTIRASNAMLGAVVDDARPVELEGDRLVLAFGQDAAFLRRKAEERATRSALTEAVRAVTGHALTFSYELREGHAPAPPQPLSDDELVARLKDEFGAEELGDSNGEEEH
ncbi:MAG TPA: DNA polymerase III subunit gamma/tau [Solirubrobacteraceae bacterium]|nr:DNA polymerase III subunit gamma/tau [Solirubrobacteraceae bacterium]